MKAKSEIIGDSLVISIPKDEIVFILEEEGWSAFHGTNLKITDKDLMCKYIAEHFFDQTEGSDMVGDYALIDEVLYKIALNAYESGESFVENNEE